MPAEKISLQNAKASQLFYFVANALVYREKDGRFLLLKRSAHEKVHPSKYCMPGGKLEWSDLDIKRPTRLNGEVLDFENALEKLLIREVGEEAGVEIFGQPIYLNSIAYVRPDGAPAILLKFIVKYKGGEVKLEAQAFDGFVWANQEEVKNYDCIKGVSEEIDMALSLLKNL